MDAIRIRGAIEWLLAAALIVLAFSSRSVIVRKFHTVTDVTPVIAHESTPRLTHDGVPARAVSVPLLVLANGVEVRVGDDAALVGERLGRHAEVGTEAIEGTPLGDRLKRFYQQGDTRFVIVFEASQHDADPRVAA